MYRWKCIYFFYLNVSQREKKNQFNKIEILKKSKSEREKRRPFFEFAHRVHVRLHSNGFPARARASSPLALSVRFRCGFGAVKGSATCAGGLRVAEPHLAPNSNSSALSDAGALGRDFRWRPGGAVSGPSGSATRTRSL